MHETLNFADGGALVCGYTHKRFDFIKTPDRSDQRRAEQELAAHQNAVVKERELAAGRKLTPRELVNGIAHKDTRTVAERAVVTNYVADANPFRSYAAELQQVLRYSQPGTRPDLEARLHAATVRADEVDAKAAAEVVVEKLESKRANDGDYRTALGHAESFLSGQKFSKDATKLDVLDAKQRLQELQESADADHYWKGVQPAIEARNERIKAACNVIHQQAAEMDARASEILSSGQIPDDVAAKLSQGDIS